MPASSDDDLRRLWTSVADFPADRSAGAGGSGEESVASRRRGYAVHWTNGRFCKELWRAHYRLQLGAAL